MGASGRASLTTLRLGPATIRWTERTDGDQRAALAGHPSCTLLHQVHGADVVVVAHPGEHTGAHADAAVTAAPGATLAILTADCAPIALAAEEGVVGAVHAGWRGLAAGVVAAAVDAMRALGAGTIRAAVGPCIHADCYEFSPGDLDTVATLLGPSVRGTTATGRPALDLPAAVSVGLQRAGVDLAVFDGRCTACESGLFSHRARADVGRQAMLVALEP